MISDQSLLLSTIVLNDIAHVYPLMYGFSRIEAEILGCTV